MVRSCSDAEALIDKYTNPMAEPARLPSCPPLIHTLARASQGVRELVIDGDRPRERMPVRVTVCSYFLRAGGVMPTVLLDILYRSDPSTIAGSGNGPPPRAGAE